VSKPPQFNVLNARHLCVDYAFGVY
jgi:hypothetical protein